MIALRSGSRIPPENRGERKKSLRVSSARDVLLLIVGVPLHPNPTIRRPLPSKPTHMTFLLLLIRDDGKDQTERVFSVEIESIQAFLADEAEGFV